MARYDEEKEEILINGGKTIIPLEVLRENPQYAEKTVEELLEYYTELEDKASKRKRVEEIDKELQEIDDSGLNRYIEDIIEHLGIFAYMFSTTRTLIEKKKTLRKEREILTVKEVESVETDNEDNLDDIDEEINIAE